ncbi:MAG: hypothetical protein NTW21_42250 [Verrucomicrobia bacterium]|nr:hypothetical protein [Verrucomicrobiota bacterium]
MNPANREIHQNYHSGLTRLGACALVSAWFAAGLANVKGAPPASVAGSTTSTQFGYDVVFLLGQSNAQGSLGSSQCRTPGQYCTINTNVGTPTASTVVTKTLVQVNPSAYGAEIGNVLPKEDYSNDSLIYALPLSKDDTMQQRLVPLPAKDTAAYYSFQNTVANLPVGYKDKCGNPVATLSGPTSPCSMIDAVGPDPSPYANGVDGSTIGQTSAITFARKYIANGHLAPNRRLLIVHVSVGSTGMNSAFNSSVARVWFPGSLTVQSASAMSLAADGFGTQLSQSATGVACPDGLLAQATCKKIVNVINNDFGQGASNRIVSFIWQQGESETWGQTTGIPETASLATSHSAMANPTAKTYMYYLKELITRFRLTATRSGQADGANIPFLVGGFTVGLLTGNYPNTGGLVANSTAIQSAFANFKDWSFYGIGHTGFADSVNPFPAPCDWSADSNNSIHFDITGQYVLGLRFYEAYLSSLRNAAP